jgi:hypothetical protein
MLDLTRYTTLSLNDVSSIIVRKILINENKQFLLFGNYVDIYKTSNNEFLGDSLFKLFSYLGDFFIPNNTAILFCVSLSFVFSVFLFKCFVKSRFFKIFLSLFFSLSLYQLSRFFSGTFSLYFVFVFPLVFLLLVKGVKSWVLGIVISLIFYTSNYYGYFCLIIVFLYYLYFLLFYVKEKKRGVVFLKLKDILIVVLVSFTVVALPNAPAFIRSTTLFGKYSRVEIENSKLSKVVPFRPVEDFFSFSFRPWYFVIPPTDSIIFGDFSKNIYQKLKNTGYFLAQNYDPQESGGSFMGWTFLGFGCYGIYLLFKKDPILIKYQKELRALLFCLVFILLLTGPPYWSAFGIKIYTPSYLMYLAFPVFRVLVRFAPVIFLILLVFSAFGLKRIEELYLKKRIIKTVFYIFILITTFLQFAIKIPIVDIKKPPEYVAYLSKKETPTVAIYPNTYWEASFWFPINNIRLANLRGIKIKESGFDSDNFTKFLPTVGGINTAYNMNLDYILFVRDSDFTKAEEFFRENLVLEKDFGGTLLFKLNRQNYPI